MAPVPAGRASDQVVVTLAVIGTAGVATTLRCGTPDDGSFEISPDQLLGFPTGPGTLTVSRTANTRAALTPTSSLDARATLVDGGAIILP